MSWQSSDLLKLPEVKGKNFVSETVVLDGKSHRECTFTTCQIVYRGGPARFSSCFVGPNCIWKFEDEAAFVLQFLAECGWKIEPPANLQGIRNPKLPGK
jgi:hypothetical protein